jgi:hypothetical protein
MRALAASICVPICAIMLVLRVTSRARARYASGSGRAGSGEAAWAAGVSASAHSSAAHRDATTRVEARVLAGGGMLRASAREPPALRPYTWVAHCEPGYPARGRSLLIT